MSIGGEDLTYRRVLLSAIIAVSLAAPALVMPSQLAVAGGNCTAWGSIDEPPPTIRVGRGNGTVEVVDFRQYVGTVLAKEWSYTHPAATLEAAAVAIKQYAWYYTLGGKWRTSYVNELGECYDVKDSTADQLYKPHLVGEINPRIWQAVDNTWGLTVRKSGKFFLTTYRTGDSKVCASDVTGWRLFAKSIINCGKIGWTREEIQLAYYAPDVTFHWMDDGVPDQPPIEVPISAPDVIDLVDGTTSDGQYVRVRWDRDGARPEGTFYQLQQNVEGLWKDVPLDDPTQRSLTTWLKPNKTHQFRVRLANSDGAVSAWQAGPRFSPKLVESTSTAFTWSSGWSKGYNSSASGGSMGYATRGGAIATFSFTGREVALVGTLGPTRGQVRIWIDGVRQDGVYDMWAKTTTWRAVWFRHEFADAGAHTIGVEVVGTSGRPRVDVDAALYLP
jgi:hypothetical protein